MGLLSQVAQEGGYLIDYTPLGQLNIFFFQIINSYVYVGFGVSVLVEVRAQFI